jgi:hypothetical protein
MAEHSYALPVTGDKVGDTTFLRVSWGYDMAKVDDLLGGAAAELDAGRPAGPLIGSDAFRRRTFGLVWLICGYDVFDAVADRTGPALMFAR